MRVAILCAAVWLFLAAGAGADVLRPLDERATGRLVIVALARIAPEMQARVLPNTTDVVVQSADGKTGRRFRVAKIHDQLRAEPNGKRREEILMAHVTAELQTMDKVAKGELVSPFDLASQFHRETVVPLLAAPNRDQSWDLPSRSHLPFPGGLVVFWVQDRTVTYEFKGQPATLTPGPITAYEARARGQDKMDLRKLGLTNLQARLDRVTEQRDGRFVTLSLKGRFGASLLLIDSLWQTMARDGQVLTAAVPRQDQLIVIADATEAELADLRRLAAETDGFDPQHGDRVSPDLFRWTGTGWEILPE